MDLHHENETISGLRVHSDDWITNGLGLRGQNRRRDSLRETETQRETERERERERVCVYQNRCVLTAGLMKALSLL